MGGLTAQMLAAMAGGATRDLASGRRPNPRDLLLTPANARRLTAELSRMRGAAMKMGQLLSMESGDFLPPELAQILSGLRADAHHMPPSQLKQVLIAQYGKDFLKRFKRFDVHPIASASIGQVHRATTLDGGEIALKIQYPGIRAAIDADIANLGSLIRLSGLVPKEIDLKPLLEEARQQLHEEADYAREAAQLTEFAQRLEGHADFAVPKPHADYSTGDILAMDFMPGRPIETLANSDQTITDTALTALFQLFLTELFDWRHVQTDPNFANYLFDPDTGRIVLLDFGAARKFSKDTSDQFQALLRPGDPSAALTDLGYLRPQTPVGQKETVLEIAALLQPALSAEIFDFGDTRLLEQLRRIGQHLGIDQGYAEVPRIEALFIQRKLAGLVLLATRLSAQVPMRRLLAPYL
ncbi:ABC1 kinase family protein [Primorskyibacter sp. 2E233]|uniref:ABC1 kinase family protein n=1 Tax=Primorskyibacter sp. 2E233 TaxID=3413431 RepID=UPI003BF1631F